MMKNKNIDFSNLNAADKITLFYLQQEQINLLKEKNKRLEIRLKASSDASVYDLSQIKQQ